jgi:hypothetical protein
MVSLDESLLPALDAKDFHPLQKYINEARKVYLRNKIII